MKPGFWSGWWLNFPLLRRLRFRKMRCSGSHGSEHKDVTSFAGAKRPCGHGSV